MPAHESIHPKQFKLFMSGKEWQDSMSDSVDRNKGQTMADVWSYKTKEATAPAVVGTHGAGVYDSLEENGFQRQEYGGNPTIIVNDENRLVQEEGHHRIAAAAEIERRTGQPMWIPTEYVEDYHHVSSTAKGAKT